MAGVFRISAENITVAAPKTLIFLNPGTTRAYRLLAASVSQSGTATAQMIRLQFVTQVSAFPTLTSYTPKAVGGTATAVMAGGTAGAAGTCGIAASAEGAGAKTVLFEEGFSNINGYLWVPAPLNQIVLPPSGSSGFGLFLNSTPTTTTGWNAWLEIEEIG